MLQGKVSNVLGALCCLGADAGGFMLRLSVRANVLFRVIAKAVLPAFVVNRIRHARKRQSLTSDRAEVRG